MPQGFQSFSAAGGLEVDLSTRINRLLGYVDSGAAGSLVEPGLAQGTPFYIPVLDQNGLMYPVNFPPISFSGTTVSWSNAGKFLFGVY